MSEIRFYSLLAVGIGSATYALATWLKKGKRVKIRRPDGTTELIHLNSDHTP